jgi:hypothetical protein
MNDYDLSHLLKYLPQEQTPVAALVTVRRQPNKLSPRWCWWLVKSRCRQLRRVEALRKNASALGNLAGREFWQTVNRNVAAGEYVQGNGWLVLGAALGLWCHRIKEGWLAGRRRALIKAVQREELRQILVLHYLGQP